MLANDAVPQPQAALADTLRGATNVAEMLLAIARFNNGDGELSRIALTESDATNLAAFLRALNEDYDWDRLSGNNAGAARVNSVNTGDFLRKISGTDTRC